MAQAVLLVFLSIIHAVNEVFSHIFPLFPQIGLVITALGILLFVVYTFKSGFGLAIKFSLGLVIVLTASSYFLGKLLKLFTAFGG